MKIHRLKITNCKSHIQELSLTDGTHYIGRTLNSTIRLEDEDVSRQHAKLLVNKDHCILIDNKSKNGTFVNGKLINTFNLCDGDTINIGKFKLTFVSSSSIHHPHWHYDFNLKKLSKKFKISLIVSVILIVCMIASAFYYRISNQSKISQIAQLTGSYLAERNKETLYLGEYASLDLSDLPKEVSKIAVWDRNGTLLAKRPNTEDLHIDAPQADKLIKVGKRLYISTLIYYESTLVGSIWLEYTP